MSTIKTLNETRMVAAANSSTTKTTAVFPGLSRPVQSDDDALYIVAIVIIIAGVAICCLLYSFFGEISDLCHRANDCCRRRCMDHSWSCFKSSRDDFEMGYLPANITVNQTAVDRGAPNVFLRPTSHSERISADHVSLEISRDSNSGVEAMSWATWSDYLRRATMRRSAGGGPRSFDVPASSSMEAGFRSTDASSVDVFTEEDDAANAESRDEKPLQSC